VPPRRSYRGGSWAYFPLESRATERGGGPADASDPAVGFRCAQSVMQ
jgi:formylglycine-generating enzyme required for sulfatase activity